MKYDYIPLDHESLLNWEQICPVDEYRVYQGGSILNFTSILPSDLYTQYQYVVIAGSAVPGKGAVYYMINGGRVDYPAKAIDQMPLGIVFIDDQASGSACLIQHSQHVNRTIYPPDEFWCHLNNSKIGEYFPLNELPGKQSGRLEDLKQVSHRDAFSRVIEKLKPFVSDEESII